MDNSSNYLKLKIEVQSPKIFLWFHSNFTGKLKKMILEGRESCRCLLPEQPRLQNTGPGIASKKDGEALVKNMWARHFHFKVNASD